MTYQWKENQPIYRQLKEMVAERIMDGTFVEGEAIPSVRQVAADYQVNHLTVGKAYQELVELGLLQKRRGVGMYVTEGARSALTRQEQQQFIDKELPAFAERARMLGLGLDQVFELLRNTGSKS